MEEVYEEARRRLLKNMKIEGDCWVWQKSCFHDGYGQSSLEGKKMRAHRLSYFLFKNKDPKKMYVCHSCDNRKCINPDHLWLGTAHENTKDSLAKGRFAFVKGEKHIASKLKESDVFEIRKLYKEGMFQRDIAKIYMVDQANISCIIRGVSWRHI